MDVFNMDIFKAINRIQTELKCGKNQYNSFGKYKYRSQEDILEAVKPLLKELGMVLTVSDEIVEVGGRVYVKATAKIGVGGKYISTDAYAREPEEKKGMDAAQITGSTSSYARKYALSGLFALDDVKDSDYGGMVEDIPNKKITPGQLKLVQALVKDTEAVCKYYNVKELTDLTGEQASEIISKKGAKT